MKIVHISAEQLLKDSFNLALQVLNSSYRPDLLVGVWRGGAPVAIAVHEAFEFTGLPCDHLCLHAKSYTGIASRQEVQLQGFSLLAEKAAHSKRILLVDDVFDSGQSMARILAALKQINNNKQPEVRIAVPYYKPGNNTTSLAPDYFLETTAAWLVFPHELKGLQETELRQKPGLEEIIGEFLNLRSQLSTLES